MARGTALVIGTNRGIGLHLVKVLSEHRWSVSGTLEETGATILDLDYLSEQSIIKAAADYGDELLVLLINCAGVDVHPRAWAENDSSTLMTKFRVMAGPFLATKAFLPKLERSDSPKIINISSDFASVSENDHGRCIGYRMAKTALNQQTVTIANELKAAGSNVVMIAVDPGDVPTRLSQGNGKTDIDKSVWGIVEIIDSATLVDSGSFLKWTGDKIPFGKV